MAICRSDHAIVRKQHMDRCNMFSSAMWISVSNPVSTCTVQPIQPCTAVAQTFHSFCIFCAQGFCEQMQVESHLKITWVGRCWWLLFGTFSAMLHLTLQPMAVVEALVFSWTSRNRIRVTRIAHVHIEGSHCCGYQVWGSLHWNQLWQDKIVNHTPRLPHDFFTAHADTKNTPLALVRPNSCVDLRCKS